MRDESFRRFAGGAAVDMPAPFETGPGAGRNEFAVSMALDAKARKALEIYRKSEAPSRGNRGSNP
jgi:hypothetical protein